MIEKLLYTIRLRMRRGRLLAAVLAVAAAAAIAVGLALGGTSAGGRELLPDLDQEAPGELSGRTVGSAGTPRFFLGFDSAASNVGEGPLIIEGSRASRRRRDMDVVQRIDGGDGTTRTRRVQALMRYVRSSDHEHWHLLDFMRYELRRSGSGLIAPDRKTGFCLGDRYEVEAPLEHAKPRPTYTEECGRGRRNLLRLREGISVGYGDDYDAHLEGQDFDVTGLPAGRYLLVHRVNAARVLRESDYSNNASSMAFELSWPRGQKSPPRVTVIRRCPDSATCS
jgi:hypothetical protein